jgi:hypothetical protein
LAVFGFSTGCSSSSELTGSAVTLARLATFNSMSDKQYQSCEKYAHFGFVSLALGSGVMLEVSSWSISIDTEGLRFKVGPVVEELPLQSVEQRSRDTYSHLVFTYHWRDVRYHHLSKFSLA